MVKAREHLRQVSIHKVCIGDRMADLSNTEVQSLSRAVGLEIEEPLLSEVAYNLNALRELIEEVSLPALDQVEPLPIILPDGRSRHEHG
jgi:hypothetical protein